MALEVALDAPPVAPAKPRDRVARRRRRRDGVGLRVGDHLDAVFERAKEAVGVGEDRGIVGRDLAGVGERRQRIERRTCAQAGVAPAPDQLVDLREELDLADAAAPALEVEAGSDRLAAVEMVADAQRYRLNVADRGVVEAPPPHERPDRGKERLPQRDVAGARPGADERGPLPRLGLRLVIVFGRGNGERDRRHLARRAQPQVDAEDVAADRIGHQRDDPPRDADGGVGRLLARAEREPGGVVQQDQIDVRRIVELVAAELAERDRDEPGVRPTPLGKRGGDARVERGIGEGRQRRRHPLERPRPAQVGERDDQRDISLRRAQRRRHGQRRVEHHRLGKRGVEPGGADPRDGRCPLPDQCAEVRRVRLGAGNRVGKRRGSDGGLHPMSVPLPRRRDQCQTSGTNRSVTASVSATSGKKVTRWQ